MKRILSYKLLLIGSLMLSLTFSGCSSKDEEGDLLSQIPSEYSFAAIADVENILKQSGCEIQHDGTFQLSPKINQLIEESDVATQTLVHILAGNVSEIKDKEILWFNTQSEETPIVTFLLNDKDSFEQKIAKSSIASSSVGSNMVYTFPECNVILGDSYCWISRDVNLVIKLQEKLKEKKGTILPDNICDLMMTKNSLRFVSSPTVFRQKSIAMVAGFLNFRDTGIRGEVSAFDSEGSVTHFSDVLDRINKDVLDFVPRNTLLLLAFGEIKDWNKVWASLSPIISRGLSAQNQIIAEGIKSYLENINGTTLFAMTPVGGSQALKNFNPLAWDCLFMTKMDEEATVDLMSTVESSFPFLGIDIRKELNDTYSFNYGTSEIRFGLLNGNIFLSNYDLESSNNGIDVKTDDALACIFLSIPKSSEFAKAQNLPWGVEGSIKVKDECIEMSLKLPGASGNALKELINFTVDLE
ncbi:MAG: hypothetical protein J1E99_06770 [Muribaculaceae bacterium]|nr:hypothetical protein [Muribaculaceae bacterium]